MEHFDPTLELIFGKHGLSERLWRGNSFYDNVVTAPDVLKQVLYDFADQEHDRI